VGWNPEVPRKAPAKTSPAAAHGNFGFEGRRRPKMKSAAGIRHLRKNDPEVIEMFESVRFKN
jgi:hypothetical protein